MTDNTSKGHEYIDEEASKEILLGSGHAPETEISKSKPDDISESDNRVLDFFESFICDIAREISNWRYTPISDKLIRKTGYCHEFLLRSYDTEEKLKKLFCDLQKFYAKFVDKDKNKDEDAQYSCETLYDYIEYVWMGKRTKLPRIIHKYGTWGTVDVDVTYLIVYVGRVYKNVFEHRRRKKSRGVFCEHGYGCGYGCGYERSKLPENSWKNDFVFRCRYTYWLK